MNPGGYHSTIVLVEDSPTQALTWQSILENRGANVIVAVDGVRGWQIIQQVLPDVVILDLEMPLMNGLEVTQAIKSHEETKHIPVILLSKHKEDDLVNQGFGAGVDEYIPKDAIAGAVLLETLRAMGLLPESDLPDPSLPSKV